MSAAVGKVNSLLQNTRKSVRQFSKHLLTWKPHSQIHFSQEGEDILLQRIFLGQRHGFYVDIGAHHPFRFSNTYWAYRQGWNGINVDPSPDFTRSFNRFRTRDINLNVCVSETNGPIPLYVFPEQALNTTLAYRKRNIESVTRNDARVIEVQSQTLEHILNEHLPRNIQQIDLMSIDVEGAEMAVLKSNDWARYKPRVLVMEMLGSSLSDLKRSIEFSFVQELGYTPVAMLYHSVFFVSDPTLKSVHWPDSSAIDS